MSRLSHVFTRRALANAVLFGFTEAGLAQRAMHVPHRPGIIWLNANEFPEGPPPAAVAAMSKVLDRSNRYHYEEFETFFSALAASLKIAKDT